MADEYREGRPGAGDLYRRFKAIGTHPQTGETVYAEMMALEAGSIGGGGGAASSVTVADGVTSTQLLAVDVNGRIGVNVNGTVPVSGTFWQATQPVSGTFWQATQPVSGTFWQATQPVSVADGSDITQGAKADAAWDGVAASASVVSILKKLWATLSGTLTVSGTVNVGNSPTVDTELTTADLDTGAGTDTRAVVGIVRAESGGAVLVGSANPMPVDVKSTVSTPVTGTFWQATQPVSGTFWQATQPVSLATNTPDVTDRAAREVGRVRIWDGTDEATVVPLRTQPATTEKAITTFDIPNRLATYACVIATQTPAITIGVKELLKIWSVNTATKDKYIVEIWATAVVTTASTAGRTTIRVSTITTAPTGGTELTKADISGAGASDMTNTMQVPTGGGTLGTTFIRKLVEWTTQPVGRIDVPVFQASNPGNGIILRGGASSGISIDIEREVAHTALVDLWTVGVRWIEV